jgi:predicted AlkP superfamily pyrophosphatase or phosphodiesterase
MSKRLSVNFIVVTSLLLGAAFPLRAEPLRVKTFREPPKLVVLVAFDQMRSDYLTRFRTRFLPAKGKDGRLGGFEALISRGAYYPFAQQDVFQSMTCPGHAMMLTGAYPSRMGISLNDWYDGKDSVYCAEDRDHKTVGLDKPGSPHLGTSPKNLIGSTVGDELKNAGYASKVVSIALKDRASIMMGGHRADWAVWFDANEFRWVSSDYYVRDGKLPAWVLDTNAALKGKIGASVTWEREGTPTGLSHEDHPPRFAGGPNVKEFPFNYKNGTSDALLTPEGLSMTEEIAEKAVQAEALGGHRHPDLLAVSFSNFDYVGHLFGPNSPEMEEMAVQSDRVLSRFLNFLQKEVPGGLDNVTLVLTSDHGAPPEPGWAQEQKLEAGRVDTKALGEKMESVLSDKFGKLGKGEKWIGFEADLCYFVNPAALAARKVTIKPVADEIKAILQQDPSIAVAFTAADALEKKISNGPTFERQALKSFHAGRSGDVLAVPKPYHVSGNKPVNHQTGYSYDRGVPLIFMGKRFRGGVYANPADTVDIAPTLSFVLGILPPSQADGRVLAEALAP